MPERYRLSTGRRHADEHDLDLRAVQPIRRYQEFLSLSIATRARKASAWIDPPGNHLRLSA